MSTPDRPVGPGPTAAEHERLRTDLGAYVLGGLPAGEAAHLVRHLETCAACHAELDELRPAAAALGALRADPVLADAEPPSDLGARVADALSQARQQDAWQTRLDRRAGRVRGALTAFGGAAAAALVAVVLLATGVVGGGPDVPLEAVTVQPELPGLQADADLIAHTWGVEVELTATGFAEGGRYRVALLSDSGRRFPAGAFVGTGSAEMHCHLNSALLRADASGFEVRDSDGDVVLTSVF